MNRVILETFWSDTHLAIPFHSLWKIKLEVKCVTIGEEEFKIKLKIKKLKGLTIKPIWLQRLNLELV